MESEGPPASGPSLLENTIAGNGGECVNVDKGDGNAVSRTSIFANGGLGIDLGATASLPTIQATATPVRTSSRTSRS